MTPKVGSSGLLTYTFALPQELSTGDAYRIQQQDLRNFFKQNPGLHVHIVTRQIDDAKIPDGKRIHGKIGSVDVSDRGHDFVNLEDLIICNDQIRPRRRPATKLDLRCIEVLEYNPRWRAREQCGCE